MLILGTVEIVNYRHWRPIIPKFRTFMFNKQVNDNYYLSLRFSTNPHCMDYDIRNLVCYFTCCEQIERLKIQFERPTHIMMFEADDPEMMIMFMNRIQDILDGKIVTITPCSIPESIPAKRTPNRFEPYDPMTIEFTLVDCIDDRVLNMKHLQKLVLENCMLPKLPMELGNLPIRHLNLSNSVLGTTRSARDTRWDLFTLDPICKTLTNLKMDSIGLYTLPFEIMYLKKLMYLSVARNRLTYLLPIIGDLPNLNILNVSKNFIRYLPDTLRSRIFQSINILGNSFHCDLLSTDHIKTFQETCIIDETNVKQLSYLAFAKLIEYGLKLKRKDIPQQFWHYFNIIGRCTICKKYILPPISVIKHIKHAPVEHLYCNRWPKVPWPKYH